MLRSAAAIAAVIIASPALAHPGHAIDTGATGWLHYVAQFDHAAPIVLLALVAVVAIGPLRKRIFSMVRGNHDKD